MMKLNQTYIINIIIVWLNFSLKVCFVEKESKCVQCCKDSTTHWKKKKGSLFFPLKSEIILITSGFFPSEPQMTLQLKICGLSFLSVS